MMKYMKFKLWILQSVCHIVRNPSVSLSLTSYRNEKVEHYIRIKDS